jgi:hypothetical protein
MENNATIDILNNIITDIEAQLEVRGCKKKIVYLSSNPELKAYNSGMLDGARIALRVINERIGRIQNDCNRNQTESVTEEVQQVQIQLPKICR